MGRKHTKAYIVERITHWRGRVRSLEAYIKWRKSSSYKPAPLGTVASKMSLIDYEMELREARHKLKYWLGKKEKLGRKK